MENLNLLAIFTAGLFAGGFSCMAVQGGLFATSLAQSEERRLKSEVKKNGNLFPILSFLIARVIAYTILGFLLGWVGSLVQLALPLQVLLQFGIAIFMLGTALYLLDVHPIFRYFIIQPPRLLTRFLAYRIKRNDIFGPSVLGVFTVLIPCGATQAMMVLAIGTGSAIAGATVLFAFVLGSSPLFFLLGYMAVRVESILQVRFIKVAAIAIILLSLFTLNSAIALTGSNLTLTNIARNMYCIFSICDTTEVVQNPVNEATITINTNGYTPNQLTVKAGSKVTLHLVNEGGNGCQQAFTIPSLNIQKIVPVNYSGTVQFTAPNQPTYLSFMCSVGNYQGIIKVI